MSRTCDKHGTPMKAVEAGGGYQAIMCQKCIEEDIAAFVPPRVVEAMVSIPKTEVVEWLVERLQNCQRIASTKPPGTDRDLWNDDARFFANAITYLTADNLRPKQ